MSSLVRSTLFTLVVVAGPLAAAPAPVPAKYDPPTAVGQVASVQRVLDEVVAFVKSVDEKSAEQIEQGMKDALGEKGWAGLDTKQQIGVYAYLKPKLENSYLVFAVPVTKEKDALDLLERLGVGVEEEEKAKGVYRLRKRGLFPEESPTRMRFHDGHAYIGINVDADELDATKLLPAKNLIDVNEKAPAAATVYLDRAPKELKEMMDGWWGGGKASLDQLENNPPRDMPKNFPAFGKACVGWAEANAAALFKDGETLGVRVSAEPKTADFKLEYTVTPKAGSQLAKDVKAVKPTQGRFQQLVTKDAVGGMWLSLGTSLPKSVRETGGPFAADLLDMLGKDAPDEVKAVLTEFCKGANAAMVDGKVDAGMALLGPDKDEHYNAVLGVGLADPAAVDKAFRAMVKGLPKEVQEMIKLDAEKAGDLSAHTFTAPDGTDWMEKMFGKKATVRVAFGKDAVYAAVGPDGLAEIKRAAGLKAADGKRMDFVVNGAKASKLLTAVAGEQPGGPGGPGMFVTAMFGKADALRSLQGVEVTGGDKLTVTYTQTGAGLVMGLFVGRSR